MAETIAVLSQKGGTGKTTAVRTLTDIFRRLGLADKIRAAGLPADVPMDVFIILAMNEPPLVQQHYPSVDEARATIRAQRGSSATDGWVDFWYLLTCPARRGWSGALDSRVGGPARCGHVG